MFQYYFLYENQIPSGMGFPFWGKIHISWLVAISLLGVILVKWYIKTADNRKPVFEKILVSIMVAMDLYKDIILLVTHHFYAWELPLDLCALAVYISFLHGFIHSKTTGEILFALCFPGALSALLFPNWNIYPQMNFVNIHSFLIHGLLVIYPLMLLISGRLKPNIRQYYRVWIFLAVLVPAAMAVNFLLGTDFLFLNLPSKDSPLVIIYNLTGKTWYLVGFGIFVLAINMIMYIPFIAWDIWKKEHTDKEHTDKEHTDKEHIDKENIDKENIDKENNR